MYLKTFKMLSFELIKENGNEQFPIVDGIIINQENTEKTWILELFISKHYELTFQKLHSSQETINVQVIISFPENDPAPFEVVVNSIREIGNDHISVLLKGNVKMQQRSKYAEQLLKILLEENLSGEDLVKRFEQGMRERPHLKGFK